VYSITRRWGDLLAILFFLTVLFAGCSDGRKNSNPENVVDPALFYKGITTQAAVTSENAESLTMSGFDGGNISSIVSSIPKTNQNNRKSAQVNLPVLQFAQILKQSTRRIEIPKKILHERVMGRRSHYQVVGDLCGTANYTLDINDVNGSFSGTIAYLDFTSESVVFDGTATIRGTMNADNHEVSRLTLSFSSLELEYLTSTFSLTGSLSWGENTSESYTQTLSMNMVLLNQETDKTYWYNNYEMVSVSDYYDIEQTISGRYYDHDFGFIDLTTTTPLRSNHGDLWPSQGILNFNGRLDSWVRLKFLEHTLVFEADTDGDQSIDWQVERESNVLPPAHILPVADAGPDQNVTKWKKVQLDGTQSHDPDGDPLSYSWSIISCPENGYPELADSNTDKPSFTPKQVGTYVFGLQVYDGYSVSQMDTISVFVPTGILYPDAVEEKWHYGVYGSTIGKAGLFITDLDDDGVAEIIAGGSTNYQDGNDFWYMASKTATGGYDQIWRSPTYDVAIVRICLADMNGDNKEDVVVAKANGRILIYDGQTRKEIRTVVVVPSLDDMAIGDLDGDATLEIVVSDGIGVAVYNADTGALEWSISTGGGRSMAIGNVDTDPGKEVVTTTYSGKGYVLNGSSGAVKWEYADSFGEFLKLGDLDSDGMMEIVCVKSWSSMITVFNADLKAMSWEFQNPYSIYAIQILDSDDDGIPEIIFGDGDVHALDVQTRKEKWFVTNPGDHCTGITMGDVDLDGQKELIWGSDRLFIVDVVSDSIEWVSQHFYGLSALDVGDVDDDGEDELVMVSENSLYGNDEGIIYIFNARTYALKYQKKLDVNDRFCENRNVKIGDVDGDGKNEIVLITSDSTGCYSSGLIQVYEGSTCSLKKQSQIVESESYSAMALGDLDGDGKVEIVTGAEGHLVVLDGTTLLEKWKSVDLRNPLGDLYDIKLADLDKDGHGEIIASMTNKRLIVFDGVSHVLKQMIESPARALGIVDADGDGFLDVLVGRENGLIDVYDGLTFTLEDTVFTFNIAPVDALFIADLDGTGSEEWLLSAAGQLFILQGKGDGHGLVCQSLYLGPSLGKSNHMAIKDVDLDGYQDIFIGTYLDIYQFEFLGTGN